MPDDLTAARYARMRWNTPLSEDHADLLVRRLDVPPESGVLDLGCGWGELLLRAVAGSDTATGTGIDTDESALARGRDLARARSLEGRVSFVRQEAATWSEPADRVLCIGSAHAFGGTASALRALAALTTPGGRVLFGDGFWERPPTPRAAELLGEGILTLDALVESVRATGWRVIHLSTADQREWDDFESTWRAGRQEWLLAHPDDPRAGEVRDQLDTQLREYAAGYRGLLGLAYLVLAR